MLTVGSKFGKYDILNVVGEGGMGVVYKAQDPHLDRTVAIKVINKEYAELPEFREQLSGEAKKTAQIDSSYVVKVWEHSAVDDTPFISYEFVSGEDFRKSISEYSLQDKIHLMRNIGEGLDAIHAVGLIHRDLKPENIKLTAARVPKILDFGLAKTIKADTIDQAGRIVGTLVYMSPEQVLGNELTHRSDLFSYGVLLYELFTGEIPFKGDYSAGILYSILYDDPPQPRDLIPDLPEWLNVTIMKLLSKNPIDRYSEIREVLQIIDNVGHQKTRPLADDKFVMPAKTVTVVDIKNLSGDHTWDYFCTGFTDDLTREISRRTRLIVSAQPAGTSERDIRELFKTCRSDYLITGNLLKWKDELKLGLSIFGQQGEVLVFGGEYRSHSDDIFEILSKAASEASFAIATAAGEISCTVDELLETDYSAYDYYLQGKNYYQTNKPEDLELAIRMYNKSLEIDPDFALAYTGLSDVYAFQYMAYYDRTPERIERAREYALQALRLNPDLPEGERSLGRYYMFTGDHERAEQEFKRSIEIDPKFAIGYRTIAWLKAIQGNPQNALEWATKALNLAPTDLETLLLISLMYLDQRKYTLALATLQRAIELGPDYGRAYYNLGIVYRKLGVFELALENFLLAIKYEGDPNSHIDAGYVYSILDDYDAALEKYQESIDADHFTFGALYYSALVERERGNDKQAILYFQKSIEECDKVCQDDPTSYPAYSYRSLAKAGLGEFHEAESIIDQLLTRFSDNADVLHNAARCYAIMGLEDKAREFINAAKKAYAGPSEKEILADPHFQNILHHKRV